MSLKLNFIDTFRPLVFFFVFYDDFVEYSLKMYQSNTNWLSNKLIKLCFWFVFENTFWDFSFQTHQTLSVKWIRFQKLIINQIESDDKTQHLSLMLRICSHLLVESSQFQGLCLGVRFWSRVADKIVRHSRPVRIIIAWIIFPFPVQLKKDRAEKILDTNIDGPKKSLQHSNHSAIFNQVWSDLIKFKPFKWFTRNAPTSGSTCGKVHLHNWLSSVWDLFVRPFYQRWNSFSLTFVS